MTPVAEWIWTGPDRPENGWVLFRKHFELPRDVFSGRLRISADARYTCWINGHRVGSGPIRSWPGQWFCDAYDVRPYLQLGGQNEIRVVVLQPGVSTFQYILQRGGLWVEAQFSSASSGTIRIVSDDTWSGATQSGYDPRTPRINCQQGFVESFDARMVPVWQPVHRLGPDGTLPWGTLRERPIAHLTLDRKHPVRLVSARCVAGPRIRLGADLRGVLTGGDPTANPVILQDAWVGLRLALDRPQTVTLLRQETGFDGPGWLKGKPIRWTRTTPLAALFESSVSLDAGVHDLFFSVDGWHHHMNFSFGVREAGVALAPLPLANARGSARLVVTTAGASLAKAVEAGASWETIRELAPFHPVPEGKLWDSDAYLETVAATALPSPPVVRHAALGMHRGTGSMEIGPGADTELVFDWGEETVGYIAFGLNASAGTMVDVVGVEAIQDDELLYPPTLHNVMRYVARDGYQRVQSVVRRGFRYLVLTVRNAGRPAVISDLAVLENVYPAMARGSFISDHPQLDAAYALSVRTLRLCMEDTFVDCPAYEQTYWVGDARTEALMAYAAFGETVMPRHALTLVAPSVRRSPLAESQVPSGWQNLLPAWSFLWILAVQEHFDYTGDISLLEETFPAIGATLTATLQHRNADGLFSIDAWNMLDWAPMDTPNHGVVVHQNALAVWALRSAAAIADRLEHSPVADGFRAEAAALAAAIQQYAWDDQRQAYTDAIRDDGTRSPVFSQQTQTILYLADIVPPARREAVTRAIIDPPEGFVRVGSPWMAFFLLEALAKMGERARLLTTMEALWGRMLSAGATTAWETFPGALAGARLTRSFCHGWSAAPAYFLPRWVLGVRPAVPGCTTIVVDPAVDLLDRAEGLVPLPAGDVRVAWTRVDDAVDLRLTLPPGVTAHLPPRFHTSRVLEGSPVFESDAAVVRGMVRLRHSMPAGD